MSYNRLRSSKFYILRYVGCLAFLLLFASCSKDEPEIVYTYEDCEPELYQMFPNASDIEWVQDLGFFVAKFYYAPNKANMEVWFTDQAKWAMSDYNYGNREEVLTSNITGYITQNGRYSFNLVEAHKYINVKLNSFWSVEVRLKIGQTTLANNSNYYIDEIYPITREKPIGRITPLSIIWKQIELDPK
ncbi:MAG: hypothetical protein HUJ98_09200 [Bacteroidaceae bacterium]|nr:hypothetical protein [Bacteroidaceae bacterium]MCF0186645.1 hypothetical protein [Bacteroidaceae bacterium]